LIVFSFLVLEYVYRTGETMLQQTYKRLRWLDPLIIIVLYAAIWVQSPPKFQPLRIAVIAEQPEQSNWRVNAVLDMTARSLKRTLPDALINPWRGEFDEYDIPTADNLKRSKYKVYKIGTASEENGETFNITLQSGAVEGMESADSDRSVLDITKWTCQWILDDLGKRIDLQEPFTKEPDAEVITGYYQGMEQLQAGNIDSALICLMKISKIDSAFIPARIGLALCYEISGESTRATNEYIKAAQLIPGSNETLLRMGEYFIRQKKWDKAEPPLKVVITNDPTEVRVYLGLTKIHPARLKDLRLNTKIALLEEAVRIDPAFENARLALATELLNTTVAHKAADYLYEGLRINPASIPLMLKLGAMELYNGNSAGARDIYNKILDIQPQNNAAVFNLGVVDYRLKEYEIASEHFNQCIEWGGSVNSYYYLGLISREMGENELAREFFIKRYELRQSDDDVYAIKAMEYASALE